MALAKKEGAKPYRYFDTPDGEDTHKKLWCVLKPTALVAFGAGTADVLAWSQPQGYLRTLGRYAYIGLPIIGVSTAFVLTSNMLASVRKQDDRANWFLGGFAAGTIIGMWARRPMVGFNCGMALGTFAAVVKHSYLEDFRMWPDPKTHKPRYGTMWSVHQDLSLMRDPPRNWTTKAD